MKFEDITHQIIESAMEVHRHLGSGFQEVIYQRALAHELFLRGISFQRELKMPVLYKEEHVGTRSSKPDYC